MDATSGTPASYGWGLGGPPPEYCTRVAARDEGLAPCISLAAAHAQLLAAAGERLLCHSHPEAASAVEITIDKHGGDVHHYDRPSRVVCHDFDFAPGEELTVFSFSEPRWAAELSVFPQHMILFGYARPPGPSNEQESSQTHSSTASEFWAGPEYGRWVLNSDKEEMHVVASSG